MLSGTLPFAMVRAYLNGKCFWVHVPWAPREDRPVFPSHLAFFRIRQVGRWRLAVFATLVIPTWKRCLSWMTRRTLGPCGHTEIPRTVDVKY